MNDEYKIIKKTINYSDGSIVYIEDLCDNYGLSLRTEITKYDKEGNIVLDKLTLLGP